MFDTGTQMPQNRQAGNSTKQKQENLPNSEKPRPPNPKLKQNGMISGKNQSDSGDSPHRFFKYVRHEDKDAYERDGWIFAADLGPTHGHYAVLMEKIEPTS